MRPVEVVEVLPLLELVSEQGAVVDDDAVQQSLNSSASMRWERSTLPLRRGVAVRM